MGLPRLSPDRPKGDEHANRIPTHLTDPQLLDALKRAACDERGATAMLVAHLAEMDARTLHLGLGFSSLFE
jgi:hypothetical protein